MIRIVTDSSSDIPTHLVDEHRIEVVPLTIRFGDEGGRSSARSSPK